MGIFDTLTLRKRPPAGTPALPAEEVRKRLLSMNRPTSPYRVIDGAAEGVDVIANWKSADASWKEIFTKADSAKTSESIFMKLDPEKHEVRAVDREYTVSCSTVLPTTSKELAGRLAESALKGESMKLLEGKGDFFRGQKIEFSFGKKYTFTETLDSGEVYNYCFSVAEIKKQIQETVTSCGWTYKGVAFGKL